MNDNIAHQIGQALMDNHPTLGRLFDWVGGVVTTILLFLGTVGGQFALIFDPTTWTMQTIASFCSIPVAIMYFIKLRKEARLADILLEKEEAAKNGDHAGN